MSSNVHPARRLVESARCAVVTSDDQSFQLGYFIPPQDDWVFVAGFADEATARRAFALFDTSVAEFRRAWGAKRDRLPGASPATARPAA